MFHTFAGNKISTQTGIGTAIAIAGVAIYSLIKANLEEQKRVSFYALSNHIQLLQTHIFLASLFNS